LRSKKSNLSKWVFKPYDGGERKSFKFAFLKKENERLRVDKRIEGQL